MNITLNITNATQLNAIIDTLVPDSSYSLEQIEAHEAAVADLKDELYAADDSAYKAFKAAIVDHMALHRGHRNGNSVVSGWMAYFTTEAHAQAFAFFMGGYCSTQVVAASGDYFTATLGNVSSAGANVYNAATKPVELVEKRVF